MIFKFKIKIKKYRYKYKRKRIIPRIQERHFLSLNFKRQRSLFYFKKKNNMSRGSNRKNFVQQNVLQRIGTTPRSDTDMKGTRELVCRKCSAVRKLEPNAAVSAASSRDLFKRRVGEKKIPIAGMFCPRAAKLTT